MKKYACLLLFAIMLNGCDDGDLTPEIIDFEGLNPESCDIKTNELIYKLKPQEALILQLEENTLDDVVGEKTINITDEGLTQLVYRTFDGVISRANICDAIRPSSPNIIRDSKAKSGTITITTTPDTSEPEPDGSTSIKGFNHVIYMSNISYEIVGGVQVDPKSFPFGSLKTTTYTSPTVTLNAKAVMCNPTKIYNYNADRSMIIDALDDSLIQNSETLEPRRSTITATQNKIVFNTYNTTNIPAGYFCETPRPATPEINETWTALPTGTIEVVTTKNGAQYIHVVTIKDVELSNSSGLKFKLPKTFLFGEITTQ
ncbi:hypothetical protein [Flavobacterium flavigenum]|uniref:hypothetical protein n=1 Tax=Flavobacterium flavigenum TaxID=3003258 RepID=UPI0022ABF090|nr:hypothetical protein [Flavobacterium flavigenum]